MDLMHLTLFIALSQFAAAFGLRTTGVLTGFVNDTQQEIALLYDPGVIHARHAPMGSDAAPRFDGTFHIDLDVDATMDRVTFSKPPLEVSLSVHGKVLHLIGAHLKSKAPHGARTRDEVMRLSIANRRKQLAQAIWLRRRVDALLDHGHSVIVLGDLNDGPGLDEYENLFGRSSVEIITGQGDRALFDPHAQDAEGAGGPSSARFVHEDGGVLEAMLDYIMVSPDLAALSPHWLIWHPLRNPDIKEAPRLRDALLTASDHFPVTLDLAITP